MSRQIATFLVGDTLLGLEILLIKAVYRHMSLTPIPGAPPHLGGLMNLRGRVVTVIDLTVCLDLPRGNDTGNQLLILKTNYEINQYKQQGKLEEADLGDDIVGFLIECMEEVLTVENEEILPAPPNLDIVEKKLIDGVIKLKNRIVLLLDATSILERVIAATTASRGEAAGK